MNYNCKVFIRSSLEVHESKIDEVFHPDTPSTSPTDRHRIEWTINYKPPRSLIHCPNVGLSVGTLQSVWLLRLILGCQERQKMHACLFEGTLFQWACLSVGTLGAVWLSVLTWISYDKTFCCKNWQNACLSVYGNAGYSTAICFNLWTPIIKTNIIWSIVIYRKHVCLSVGIQPCRLYLS